MHSTDFKLPPRELVVVAMYPFDAITPLFVSLWSVFRVAEARSSSTSNTCCWSFGLRQDIPNTTSFHVLLGVDTTELISHKQPNS